MGVYSERLPGNQQVSAYRASHDELLHYWSRGEQNKKPQQCGQECGMTKVCLSSNRDNYIGQHSPPVSRTGQCDFFGNGPVAADKADDRPSSYEKFLLFPERCSHANDNVATPSPAYRDARSANCYYDMHLASKCHKLLNQCSGKCASTRVLLFPEEEWAKSAPGIQWSIKLNRWWKRHCTVTELRAGGRRVTSAVGKLTQNQDGTLTIAGRFKRNKDPDFRLHLSARVTKDDFERGYALTGALQLGDLKGDGRMEITHFAVVPRYQAETQNDSV